MARSNRVANLRRQVAKAEKKRRARRADLRKRRKEHNVGTGVVLKDLYCWVEYGVSLEA